MEHGLWYMMKVYKLVFLTKLFLLLISIIIKSGTSKSKVLMMTPKEKKKLQQIPMMNKQLAILLCAIKHSWDGYIIMKLTKDMDVFMLYKHLLMKLSLLKNNKIKSLKKKFWKFKTKIKLLNIMMKVTIKLKLPLVSFNKDHNQNKRSQNNNKMDYMINFSKIKNYMICLIKNYLLNLNLVSYKILKRYL